MNKKLIVILLSIFIILVSVDFGVKYYESLTDNVNISITPADNNITQDHNLTVYINTTDSVPFRSFLIDATTYTSGAEIQYLGPDGNTPQNLYGLIKFNITGNEKIITSWNGTVLQNSGYRSPCYTLAPAGYYRIDHNTSYSLPLNDSLINPIITYNNPEIHLSGIYCTYHNESINNNESINVSLHDTHGSSASLNGSAYIHSWYNQNSYANFTSSNGNFSIKLKNVQYLVKNGDGVTRMFITTQYGKLFIVFAFGGEIE